MQARYLIDTTTCKNTHTQTPTYIEYHGSLVPPTANNIGKSLQLTPPKLNSATLVKPHKPKYPVILFSEYQPCIVNRFIGPPELPLLLLTCVGKVWKIYKNTMYYVLHRNSYNQKKRRCRRNPKQ